MLEDEDEVEVELEVEDELEVEVELEVDVDEELDVDEEIEVEVELEVDVEEELEDDEEEARCYPGFKSSTKKRWYSTYPSFGHGSLSTHQECVHRFRPSRGDIAQAVHPGHFPLQHWILRVDTVPF